MGAGPGTGLGGALAGVPHDEAARRHRHRRSRARGRPSGRTAPGRGRHVAAGRGVDRRPERGLASSRRLPCRERKLGGDVPAQWSGHCRMASGLDCHDPRPDLPHGHAAPRQGPGRAARPARRDPREERQRDGRPRRDEHRCRARTSRHSPPGPGDRPHRAPAPRLAARHNPPARRRAREQHPAPGHPAEAAGHGQETGR